MNLVALLDLVACGILCGGLIMLLVRLLRHHHIPHQAFLALSLMVASLAFCLCLFVEWTWQIPFFANAEDFIAVLLPMFWGVVLYGIHQHIMRSDLKASERLHRQFVENQPVGLCRTTFEDGGRFVLANRALARMFGFESVAHLMAYRVADLYADQADRKRLLERLLAEERVEGLELEGRKLDGTRIYASMTMQLIRDKDGTPSQMEGTLQDITDRKGFEQALKEREQLHRRAQRIAKLGHWEVLRDTRFPIWSEQMYRITEIDRETFDGSFEQLLERIHPEDRPAVERLIPDAMAGDGKVSHVHRLLFPDHRIKYVHVTGHVEYDDDGRPSRIVGTTQDVTDVKKAEIEKEKTERRLLQAQKIEAIGTLAGGIAHDFNNILTSIIGYTQLSMRDLPAESPTMEKLDAVMQAGLRARDLVANILAFSRESAPGFKPVEVSVVVKEVVKLLRATIPTSIEILQDIDAQCGRVLADPVQIHQVVMNLGTNAYHAIGAGGGKITIALSQRNIGPNDLQAGSDVRPGPHIHLCVSDTGHGMDRQTLDKVFEPYFTTKTVGEGTGLGLSVVHGIVKKMHGMISVYSEPERDPCFMSFCPSRTRIAIRPARQVELPLSAAPNTFWSWMTRK